MTSSKRVKSTVIGNDRAWKIIMTNYYIGKSLYSNGQI